MKPFRFENYMKNIIGDTYCANIAEIGTNRGKTAAQLIHFLAPRVDKLHYTGYDVFEYAFNNDEFNLKERNGKKSATLQTVTSDLNKLKEKYKNFDFELHKGFTTDTLVKPVKYDFVYIDGGHSYETVKHDYSMVKDSKIIVFDDVHMESVYSLVKDIKDVEIIQLYNTIHKWAVVRNEI